MTQFLNESFTGTDGVDIDTLTGWTRHSSYANTGLILSNRARLNTANTSTLYYHSATPGNAEETLEAVVRWVSAPGSTYSEAGPSARIDTAADTAYRAFYHYDSTSFRVYLQKKVTGTNTNLGNWNSGGLPSNGTDYTIKFECFDAAKKVYNAGTERVSSADNVITGAGKVGIHLYMSASADTTKGYHIDSMTASDTTANAKAGSLAMTGVGI